MKKSILLICSLLCACSSYNKETTKTYVISLDRTPKCFSYVKKQFENQNIKCERFSAVDGYKLEFQNIKTGEYLTSEQKKDFYNYTWKNKPTEYNVILNGKPLMKVAINKVRFSLGKIGCACSHREIWKETIKNNYDKVFVFEDDVILDEDFKKNLPNYVKDLPNDWDIAFLGVGRRNNKYGLFPCVGEIFRDLDNVKGHQFVAKIQPTNLCYGTHGYIINPRGAKKLLALTDMSDYPIDDIVFQRGGINTGKVKGYVAMKKFVEQKLGNSEIKKMGRSY